MGIINQQCHPLRPGLCQQPHRSPCFPSLGPSSHSPHSSHKDTIEANDSCSKPSTGSHCAQNKTQESSPSYQTLHNPIPSTVRPHFSHRPHSLVYCCVSNTPEHLCTCCSCCPECSQIPLPSGLLLQKSISCWSRPKKNLSSHASPIAQPRA